MLSCQLRFFCYVCGHENLLDLEVPFAPDMSVEQVTCEKCGDQTHILATACPACKESFRYFLSDLDFPDEIRTLAKTYVHIVDSIRDAIKEYVSEFDVSLPKRWSVRLTCSCGHEYTASLSLPH